MSWTKNYSKLQEYFLKFGDSKVPHRYKEDPALGRWVQKLRMKKEKLSARHIKMLDQIKFAWKEDIQKDKRKNWLTMYVKLKKFKEREGHCNVPSKWEADKKLGRWVEVLRLRKANLEHWQLEKLKEIDFKWSEDIQISKRKRWYAMYNRLEAFFKMYGHSNVPEYWEADEELSIWVIGQRRPKKALSKDKVILLKLLNFSFNGEIGLNKRNSKGRFISNVKNDEDEKKANTGLSSTDKNGDFQ